MSAEAVAYDATKQAIEESRTVRDVKDIRDRVKSLADYMRSAGEGRDRINQFAEAKVRAEWKGGLLLRAIERSPGERTDLTSSDSQTRLTPYQMALNEAGLPRDQAHRWEVMSWLPQPDLEAYFAKQREAGKIITSEDVFRLGKKHMPQETLDPIDLDGKWQCLVVDPPWTMEKIERDVRPNQAGFDYPTMTEAELSNPDDPKWRGAAPPAIAADDAHLYLWTTHKHMPVALNLAGLWGFKYECVMTWVKNVGFTPFSWMRSTEHVLFCRKGNLPLQKLGMRLDFQAKVREHSRKPDEFYEIVKLASPGPRIDVFSREKRDGFDQWGNQIDTFAEAS